MFMCFSGIFDSIVVKKQAKYVIWELIYELCICYELYNGNMKFCELVNTYWVQWLMWSVKVALLGLIMTYREWWVYWVKNNENSATQVQVIPSWMFMFASWPLTFINRSQVYLNGVFGQPSRFIDFLNQAMLQLL